MDPVTLRFISSAAESGLELSLREFDDPSINYDLNGIGGSLIYLKAEAAAREELNRSGLSTLSPVVDTVRQHVRNNQLDEDNRQVLQSIGNPENYLDLSKQLNQLLFRSELATDTGLDDARKILVKAEIDYKQTLEDKYLALREEALEKIRSQGQSGAAKGVDHDALTEYLRHTFPDENEISVTDSKILPGGYSKSTVILKLSGNKALPGQLVLRIDADRNFLATSVTREYPILQVLYDKGACVPRPWCLEDSGEVLGTPFMGVSKAAGSVLGSITEFPPPNPELCRQMAVHLAELHKFRPEDLGNAMPEDYATTLEFVAADIEKEYQTWSALNHASPIVEGAFSWLRSNLGKADGDRTLIHRDYNLHNLMFDNEQMTAILDWEFATLGNPVEDMGYLYDTAVHLDSWEAFVKSYVEAGGTAPDPDQLDFYILWGRLRLSIMVSQVDVAFRAGQMDSIKHAFAAANYGRQFYLRPGYKLDALWGD